MTEFEFSREVQAVSIGADSRPLQLSAGPEERAALARRFGLAAIETLEAEVTIGRAHGEVVATGRLTAKVVQSCVITGAAVAARVDEQFTLRFRAEIEVPATDEEGVELGEDELDLMFYDGTVIDLGEAVAQTLALALDPYPRAAGAALKHAGAMNEAEARPFGMLASLKDKLGQ